MHGPNQYSNLIKMGYFHEVAPEDGYKEQYLLVAKNYLADAAQTTTPATKYLLGYEAYYQVVQAILEWFGVRATDRQGHRTVAISTSICRPWPHSGRDQADDRVSQQAQ